MLLLLFTLYGTCTVVASHTNDFPENLARPLGAARRSIRSEVEALVCETEECRTIAKVLKDSINEKVDPCNDFYEYACGGWTENNPAPSNDEPWHFLIKAQKKLISKAIDLLKEDVDSKDVGAVKLCKRYYRNCMDQEQSEKDGLEPLIATLSRAGGWPMIMEPNEWSEDIYLWQNVDDYYARLTGENAFHKITVIPSENPSRLSITYRDLPEGSNRLFINMTSDTFDTWGETAEKDNNDRLHSSDVDTQEFSRKKFKLSAESRRNYTNLVTEVAIIIAHAQGTNIPKQQLAKDIDDMFKFMAGLRNAMAGPITNSDMSLLKLHKWYNTLRPINENAKIDWLNKLALLFAETDIDITSDIEVKLQPRYYFENLRELLDRIPRRTIVNYIHWQFISDVIKVTTKPMKELHEQMISTSNSHDPISKTEEELSRRCMIEIDMFQVLYYLFTKKYFSETIVNEANKIISLLKKQVETEILESEWLDEVSKNNAIERIRNMEEILKPRWYKNASIMENYFQGLTVGPSRFDNFLNSKKFKLRRELRTLKEKEPVSLEGQMIPLIFDASYYGKVNTVLLTPADFQDPFFSLSRPSVINYGMVGTVIAHEINHAFHDDEETDISNGQNNLFTTVNDAYQKRVKCFVDQFNNYTSKYIGSSLNYGKLTRDENIADTIGLETALAGYYLSRKEKENIPVQKLPGLEKFNVEQLFYLSFALIHCKADMIQKENKNKTNPHSSSRLRVTGSVSNSKNFGKSFNCPVGSPMNPAKKCNIWS